MKEEWQTANYDINGNSERKSSRHSGGIIAGIIISCITLLAIIGILVIYSKKGHGKMESTDIKTKFRLDSSLSTCKIRGIHWL